MIDLKRDIPIFKRGFSEKKKQQFYTDLQLLLSSGIDIKTAFDLVIDNFENKQDLAILQKIKNEVEAGSNISTAIKNKAGFSIFETASLTIGEETGRLPIVMEHLSQFFKRKVEQKRKILSSLAYPLLIIATAVGSVIFMLNFVVPMFETVLHRFGNDLPALTKFVIKISHNLRNATLLVFILLTVAFIISYNQSKKKSFKKIQSNILLNVPIFGLLIQKYYLAQFCLFMELLVSSKIPLLKSITLLKKMISFYPIKIAIEDFETEIIKGKLLHECMSKHSIFDKRMRALVKVGEEVNKLDVVLGRLKDQYNQEIDYRIGMLNSLLEPLMIIIIGLFVGVILISMYLPMFQLGSGLGH